MDRHLLVEKYIDGALTAEEQDYIISECTENEEFRGFWSEAMKDVAVTLAAKDSEDTKAFLSTALFLDRKIARKRKKAIYFKKS